jgi:hypothetical protein
MVTSSKAFFHLSSSGNALREARTALFPVIPMEQVGVLVMGGGFSNFSLHTNSWMVPLNRLRSSPWQSLAIHFSLPLPHPVQRYIPFVSEAILLIPYEQSVVFSNFDASVFTRSHLETEGQEQGFCIVDFSRIIQYQTREVITLGLNKLGNARIA